MFLFLRNSNFYINLKNEDDLNIGQLFTDNFILWTPFVPNQIVIDFLIDQSP